METVRVVAGVVIGVLGIGIAAGFTASGVEEACTTMACPCGEDGEMTCNTCYSENPLFMTGVVNVVRQCSGPRIQVCRNGSVVDGYVPAANQSCRMEWHVFGTRVAYMFDDPSRTVRSG